MNKKEIVENLTKEDPGDLFKEADKVRKYFFGEGILARGIIDFSNRCVRNCMYCGLRNNNIGLERYSMTKEEILDTAGVIVENNIKTIILQSGDDFSYTRESLCDIIKGLKDKFKDIAITLSIGERPFDDYIAFKEAGADRYLLKHETINPELYHSFNPGMSIKHRIEILEFLKKTGYQVGTGFIVGFPGQTAEDIADDILFLKDFKPDMSAIGPLIPQADTPLKHFKKGSVDLTLRAVAITRIITKLSHIPATTALANTDEGLDAQVKALRCGANVIMPDFTPPKYSKFYRIYDKSTRINMENAKKAAALAGRYLEFLRGDSYYDTNMSESGNTIKGE